MFLDEKIVQIVLDNKEKLQEFQGRTHTLLLILKLCSNNITDVVREQGGSVSPKELATIIKRICHSYDLAAETLSKERDIDPPLLTKGSIKIYFQKVYEPLLQGIVL